MPVRGAIVVAVLVSFARIAAADTPDLPFGMLDRMRFSPFYLGATDEVSSGHGSSALTLHVQASTECECRFSFYGTLPMSIVFDRDDRLAASGSPSHDPRTALGTADIGVFGGGRRGDETTIFRVGALLPTGARDPHPWLPSARAGDRVLELPRSAGVRTSVSRQYASGGATYRVEAGIDVAAVLALPGNPVHVIPRAGAGMLFTPSAMLSYSIDTAVSADPFVVDDHVMLRWSAGLTARYARHHGHISFLQPAVTIATTHTDDGWTESLLVDLIATSAALADGY